MLLPGASRESPTLSDATVRSHRPTPALRPPHAISGTDISPYAVSGTDGGLVLGTRGVKSRSKTPARTLARYSRAAGAGSCRHTPKSKTKARIPSAVCTRIAVYGL
eukprot:3480297-Rhodomonas_salina.6